MAMARSRRSDSGMNYWPGFVDALSTLILGIIFLLTIFVVIQFYLQQEVQGKDTALARLNAQIANLTDLLSMEKSVRRNWKNWRRAFGCPIRERARDLRPSRDQVGSRSSGGCMIEAFWRFRFERGAIFRSVGC